MVLHVGGAESFLEAWCNGMRLGFMEDRSSGTAGITVRLGFAFDPAGGSVPAKTALQREGLVVVSEEVAVACVRRECRPAVEMARRSTPVEGEDRAHAS
ncbi:MAG: hypothetical protein WCQ50_05020 [Spirochaetota bacterium]